MDFNIKIIAANSVDNDLCTVSNSGQSLDVHDIVRNAYMPCAVIFMGFYKLFSKTKRRKKNGTKRHSEKNGIGEKLVGKKEKRL